MNSEELRNRLFSAQDIKYREFQQKLIPNILPESIIGVRTPELRKLAKEMSGDAAEFLTEMPHRYFEENQVHSFIIAGLKDFGNCIELLEDFLPYVDNWATCDQMSVKLFKKHTGELLEYIKNWISSGRTYTVRYGVGCLMNFYLDDEFRTEYLEMAAKIRSEEYYVNMMIAWYFATALAKQYDAALPFIENHRLSEWTHRKAIQKAIESYRITDEQKAYLRTLK